MEEKVGSKEKKFITKNKIFIVVIIILFIIFILREFSRYEDKKLVDSFEKIVYPEVHIFDTDVSGMTEKELNETLKEMVNIIGEKTIDITNEEESFVKSYVDLGVSINYEEFQDIILSYGKDKSFEEKLNMIEEPKEKTYEFELTYEEDKVNEFLDVIAEEVKINPTNATISVTNNNVKIVDDKVGKELNKEELVNNITKTITNVNSDLSTNIELVKNDVIAEITKDELESVNHKISEYTTYFKEGPSGENLIRASYFVDDSLIMPGEIFSFGDAMGSTTLERGFVYSNTYVNGEVVQGLGGGVCQLSSTLYGAELRAGILPLERVNHMMTVSYVPLGLDATLAEGYIDLRFENIYDHPIVVNVVIENYSVTVEFWSNQDTLGGIWYEPKSYPQGEYYAETYLYGYDSNNNLVYDEFVNSSTYQPFKD